METGAILIFGLINGFALKVLFSVATAGDFLSPMLNESLDFFVPSTSWSSDGFRFKMASLSLMVQELFYKVTEQILAVVTGGATGGRGVGTGAWLWVWGQFNQFSRVGRRTGTHEWLTFWWKLKQNRLSTHQPMPGGLYRTVGSSSRCLVSSLCRNISFLLLLRVAMAIVFMVMMLSNSRLMVMFTAMNKGRKGKEKEGWIVERWIENKNHKSDRLCFNIELVMSIKVHWCGQFFLQHTAIP